MQNNTSAPVKDSKPSKRIGQLAQLNQILKEIDHLFGDGKNYSEKLSEVPQLLIPGFADWCCIHLLDNENSFERIAFIPAEKINSQVVYDWVQNDLPNDEVDGLPVLVQSGEPKLVSQVNPIRRGADAGIQSYILIPLISHQQLLGAITLIYADSGRHYRARELAIAENLGLHITAYLERSLSHHESLRINEELEQRVGQGTVELEETLAHLKQTEEINQALFRVSKKLNATLDVEQILDALAQEAIQMVNGESGFAGLRTAEGMVVHKYFHDGVEIPFEYTWSFGEGIPGWVLKFKVPYGTSDAGNDPLLRRDLAINANVRSIICTPILDTTGEVIAYFDIRNKKGEESFTIADQEMLLMLAPVASIAIQNALTYQKRLMTVNELRETSRQLQELAVGLENAREEERVQISRELHDELGQSLTALKFDLAWISDQLEQKESTLAQKSRDITSQMNLLIKTVRRIATELRPAMLDDLGLIASIEWQAHDFEKRSGIECKLNLPTDELLLARNQSLAIFRIFQEALTNVGRYSNATRVDISLEKAGELLILEMHDNGKGIQKEQIFGKQSLGLIGMRERAKYLGGTFEIYGAPDLGTTLKVSIPIGSSGKE